MEKKAIIVGASAGIGAALGHELVRRGYRVALVARRAEKLETVRDAINQADGREMALIYEHDVSQFDAVGPLFEKIMGDLGSVDMVVFNAGVADPSGPEEYSLENDRMVMEVNAIGAMAWLGRAADHFQKRGAGSIVGVSSVAGLRGRRGKPSYAASKAAMNSYLESLRNRLLVKGVSVTTILPGFIDTDMTQGMDGLFWLIGPEEAARQIAEAADQRKNVVYVPGKWRYLMWIVRLIPTFVFKRLSI